MCFEFISRESVRPFYASSISEPVVGDEIELTLMQRNKIELIPHASDWAAADLRWREQHSCPYEGEPAAPFSRLLLTDGEAIARRAAQESDELAAFRAAAMSE